MCFQLSEKPMCIEPNDASASFVSYAPSVSPYRVRPHERSTTPTSSVAWTHVTTSSRPRALFTFVLYGPSSTLQHALLYRRTYDRDELHWLPVYYWHIYKICLLVYKCLQGTAASYLVDKCIPGTVKPARSSLRSRSSADKPGTLRSA